MVRIGPVVLAVGALLAALGEAGAVPFVLGDKVCGSMAKTRLGDGSVAWRVVDCPPLERLVECGDGVLADHEACDRGLPESCPGRKVCVACQACVRADGAPTPLPPTPTPAPTPTPPSACTHGELPPLGTTGFLGVDQVSIAGGQTHTYCVSVPSSRIFFDLSVIDRTGPSQCSWFSVTLTPPAGSGRTTRMSEGRDVQLRDFSVTSLPQGTWRVSIRAAEGLECAQRYLLAVSFD